MWRWCACINRVYRRLLAVVVRVGLSPHAVNIPKSRLKNMDFFVGLAWGCVEYVDAVPVAGVDMTLCLDFWRICDKIY